MAEYIEREAALRAVHGQRGPCRSPAQNQMLDYLKAAVIRIPAADVAPVVHGRWIHDGCRIKGGIDWCHCSECGKSDNFCARTNYCPNCGAKMDGGDNNEAD